MTRNDHVSYAAGRTHTMPGKIGQGRLLPAVIRAARACFAETDILEFHGAYGPQFKQILKDRTVRAGAVLQRYYEVPVSSPALEAILRGLDSAGDTAGCVYFYVRRGAKVILEVEHLCDWLWLHPDLPTAVDQCMLRGINQALADRHRDPAG